MQPNREYLFKFTSKVTPGSVVDINYRVDVNTQELLKAEQMSLNDIAQVEVHLDQKVAVDPYAHNRATGAFIMIDRMTNITVGAGMVDEIKQPANAVVNTQISEFEVELNALIRKHFPHWGAKDIIELLKK